jgi:hypothetical protein
VRASPLACRSVRRLPGPFAAAVTPVCTSHRVSLPTLDGYSSRSQPVFVMSAEYVAGRTGRQAELVAGRCATWSHVHRGPIGRELTQERSTHESSAALTQEVAVRSPRTGRRARSDTEGTWDRSWSARTGGTSTRDGSRRCGSAGTSRTGPGPAPSFGGEGGIRTHEVSRLCAFQERRHQPLGHLSAPQGSSERPACSPPREPRPRATLDTTNDDAREDAR